MTLSNQNLIAKNRLTANVPDMIVSTHSGLLTTHIPSNTQDNSLISTTSYGNIRPVSTTNATRRRGHYANGYYCSIGLPANYGKSKVNLWKRSGSEWIRLDIKEPANDFSTGVANPTNVRFSSDANYLAIGLDSWPSLVIYKRTGDLFTDITPSIITSLPQFPSMSAVNGIRWNYDNSKLAVVHTGLNFTINGLANNAWAVFERVNDNFYYSGNATGTASDRQGQSIAFNADGTKLAIGMGTTPFINVYDVGAGNTYTNTAASFGTIQSPQALQWTPDGNNLLVGGTTFFYNFYRSGNTFTLQQSLNVGAATGDFDLSPQNKLLVAFATASSSNRLDIRAPLNGNTNNFQSLSSISFTPSLPPQATYNATWISNTEFICNHLAHLGVSGYINTSANVFTLSYPSVALTQPNISTSVTSLDLRLCSISSDGLRLAYISPTVGATILYKSGNTFTFSNVITGVNLSGVKWSPNGNSLVVYPVTTSTFKVYDRSGNAYTILSDPAQVAATSVQAADWNNSSNLLATGSSSTTNSFAIFSKVGTTLTRIFQSNTQGNRSITDLKFSPDSRFIVCVGGFNPGITFFENISGTWTRLGNVATFPNPPSAVAWAPNGNLVALSTGTAPYVQMYSRGGADGNTFTRLDNNMISSAASQPRQLRFTKDGTTLWSFNPGGYPYYQAWRLTGNTWSIITPIVDNESFGNPSSFYGMDIWES
jgi:hypothetical protein